ncbi:amphiphysin isoform X2 [Dunckerocampus dactyliophorus]|uniref:amphiphysin isoform X2 n=1 Tax=Dunckerocampus dactyliophorus TaxID=161453 RepID=UPI002404CED4|nr:amphiphysin isoform X2 [Dunckerocampus dactyliophorus]
MADIKTGIFAKNVQKRLNRAQEKVLQKLGKADETKDEQFEQVVINFRRQECEGSRLQREMKGYLSAIKGMQQASINLTQSLHEVYEPDWHGKDDVMTIGKDCDALWENFHNKLVDSTLLNLDEYLLQFPDLKNRVAKRSRKLIDFDSARHHVETLQASGMKNDRKMLKADEELRKAQRVFDELNVGLQDELPTLWDSRVGFYIGTFKSVTSLEAKFHREISLVCKQLYEVMMQLSEQHADKMFTIQGAPSDSGPLRLARTPSPPEEESPPESPDATSNHMLRPVSPGPPRPRSPVQGPPVPPPPKVTPSKEVVEEQIIDLFGGEFLPAPSPSQPNERPGESLLDLDFDTFQPDESVSPIPQTAVPWDTWSAQPSKTAEESGFVADWSADFGPANGEAAPGVDDTAVPEGAESGDQAGDTHWAQADGPQLAGDRTTSSSPPQDSEAAEDEVSSWDGASQTNPKLLYGTGDETETGQEDSKGNKSDGRDRRKSTPGLIFTNEYGEQIEDCSTLMREKWSRSPDGSGSEYETAEEFGDGLQGGGWASADDEPAREDHPAVRYAEGEHENAMGSRSSGETKTHRKPADEKEPKQADFMLGDVGSQGGGPYDSLTLTETQGGGTFDSDPLAETQGEGSFESLNITETQGREAFDSDPFAETQGRGAFDSDPFAETQEGGAFDSDPFAETQGGGVFDSDPFAETQEGGAFDSDPFAETEGGGAFDSDPFAEMQGVGALDSYPFAETEEGGPFDSDPFAEMQGVGALDSAPFAETQEGGAFDSDPFAETEGGGAFDSDTFAETKGGETCVSDPFAETQGEGACDSDPFAETQVRDNAGSSKLEDSSGEKFFVASGDGGSGWDPFANSLLAASSAAVIDANVSWKQVSKNSSFDPPIKHRTTTTEVQDVPVNVPKIRKEPESSDMSEDEAANLRLGKLYQDLAKEKEEDATGPSFFAAFDQMNEVNVGSTEGSKMSGPVPPAGEEDTSECPAPPKEEELTESASCLEEKKESPVDETSETMPIPSVVIEPASSNEGDDDRDADIISPSAISDNGVAADKPSIKPTSSSAGMAGLPSDFLYKVETMHDFEAANCDELDLKQGDVVLVVPTASIEDQEAGWLTGFKESDWTRLGTGAQKGLFPENFIQRLE